MTDQLSIYVGKGAPDNERRVSFPRPERISAAELMEHGFAIDGNQAIVSVSGEDRGDGSWIFFYPLFKPKQDYGPAARYSQGGPYGRAHTLSEALLFTERNLVRFLGEYDYEVQFA